MQSSAASNSAQGPSSSAPVLEFVCLFTHDLKRKQKRWQDGRLKFHAFNKRIMVYDERGNFIGDTHWREDYEFGDGDEVQLERGGVIVQAAECLGTHSQDLSELIDKRVHEKVQRQSAAAAARQQRSAPSRGVLVAPHTITPHFQLHHTPLQNLLGTPTGHHGRALAPTESPFEERQRLNAQRSPNQQDESPRPAKKRRTEVSPPSKSGYAQSLFGTTLTLSGRPMSSAPVRHNPHHSQVHRREHIPPSSSDLSNQQDPDDQVRQVSPLAKATTQSSLPLSENRIAANNIPKALPEAVIGKNARSKANVPSLLRQTTPRVVEGAVEHTTPVRPHVQVPRKVIRLSDPGGHSDPPSAEQAVTKSTQKKRGADESHKINQLPQKPPKGRNRATNAGNLETADNTATSRLHGPTPLSLGTQEAPKTLYKEPNEPAISVLPVTGKSVTREPRIELRVAPSKKRGLVMLSEISKTKKIKRSGKPEPRDDSASSGISQTEIDQNSTPGLKTENDSSKGHSSKSAMKGRLDEHTIQNQHMSKTFRLATGDLSDEVNPVPGADEMTNTLVLDDTRTRVTSNAALIQKRSGKEEKTHSSFAHEPTQETVRHTRTRQKAGRPIEIPKQHLSQAYQDHTMYTIDEPGPEVATVCYAQADSHQDSNLLPRNMEDYERVFDEILSKRPDNAPPPRLAQFPRKSVRSREVIGLFYEDNDVPRFQPTGNIRPAQRKASGSQQRPPAATGSFSKDDDPTNPAQADGEATPEIPARLVQQHRTSSEVRANVVIHQIQPTKQTTKKPLSPPAKKGKSDQQNPPSPIPPDMLVELHLGPLSKHMHSSSKPLAPPAAEGDDETHTIIRKTKDVSTRGNRTSPSSSKDKDFRGQCTSAFEALSGSGQEEPGRLRQRLPRSVSDLSLEGHVSEGDVQKEDQVVNTVVISRAPVPRIVNPATRGKKAAKPSDAAGQVPGIILPSDDRALGWTGIKPAKELPNALPGFSKANGGAWSREAHDLFEYKRPG